MDFLDNLFYLFLYQKSIPNIVNQVNDFSLYLVDPIQSQFFYWLMISLS